MKNSDNILLIVVIGLTIYAIICYNKENFTIEHLAGPTAGAGDALYNQAMSTSGGKAVNNIIDDVASKLTQNNKLPDMKTVKTTSQLNNLFTDDLKGVSSPVNVSGFVPDKLNTVSTPDTAGLLTPELQAMIKKDNNQKLVSKDLLPKDKKADWFADIPATVTLDDANMNAYYITLPMIGSSRKNSSYDVRCGLAVPKFQVSVWNNSSYDVQVQNGSLC